MSATYHYRKAGVAYGPYALGVMQELVRQGQIGRSHQVRMHGDFDWKAAADFPELFSAKPPLAGFAAQATGPTDAAIEVAVAGDWQGRTTQPERPPSAADAAAPAPPPWRPERAGRTEDQGVRSVARRGVGVSLAGFICSTVAIVVLAIPSIACLMLADSLVWVVMIVPFLVLAVVGLILSVQGLSTSPRGFAITGTVLGVVGTALGVVALLGWLVLPWRMAIVRGPLIDGHAMDKTVEASNLSKEIERYRGLQREDGEDDASYTSRAAPFRRQVGHALGALVSAYDGHLKACAKTSLFKASFEDLGRLRRAIKEVEDAALSVEDVTLVDVLESAGLGVQPTKMLMDMLSHYERGEVTLRQAEGKMAGL